MYLQEIVEVAIGLLFAWLIISLATMQVQEIVARVLKKRAHDLEKAIGNLLANPDMLKEFYNHPLIESLKEPLTGKKAEKAAAVKDRDDLKWYEKWQKIRTANIPSYIPPETFSTVLFDIVTKAGTEDSPIQTALKDLNNKLDTLADQDAKTTIKAGLERISQLGQVVAASEVGTDLQKEIKKELKKQVGELHKRYKDKLPQLNDLKTHLKAAIDDAKVDWKGLFTSDLLVDQLDIGVKKLLAKENTSDLGISLRSLLAGINEYATDVDHAIAIGRKNVEKWFENSMDRLSGWYKRWAQKIAFVVAFVIAIVFNVDSLYMAQEFWRNPALREASSVYVQNFMEQNANAGNLDSTDLTVVQKDLETIDFPTGWHGIPSTTYLTVGNIKVWDFWSFWLTKLIGWLVTAAAAMQGAPFWFDLLKKLVNIRSTGTNPNEKPKKEGATAA